MVKTSVATHTAGIIRLGFGFSVWFLASFIATGHKRQTAANCVARKKVAKVLYSSIPYHTYTLSRIIVSKEELAQMVNKSENGFFFFFLAN